VYFEMRSVVYIYSVFVELVFQYTMDVFFSAHRLSVSGSVLPFSLPLTLVGVSVAAGGWDNVRDVVA
jgi:hypothetical protein